MALSITKISKQYKQKLALNNVNLEIKDGEFIALLGPNGAGKSTLINILASAVKKTTGTIVANGFNIDSEPTKFKLQFGIVPQDINFDPFFKVIDVLRLQMGLYGVNPNDDLIEELLENLGLKEKIDSISRSLSGGMKRRLLIAKALVHNPDIVVLDEPTAGVDLELKQQMYKYIKTLNKQGKTIILTTHYLEEAEELCNKIAIIDKGQLLHFENKDTLINKIGTKSVEITLNKIISLNEIPSTFNITKTNDYTLTLLYSNTEDMGIFIEFLHKSNYKIINLLTKSPSLEDVFLKLTGSSLHS